MQQMTPSYSTKHINISSKKNYKLDSSYNLFKIRYIMKIEFTCQLRDNSGFNYNTKCQHRIKPTIIALIIIISIRVKLVVNDIYTQRYAIHDDIH